MVEDIRSNLNYNYKITAQKIRDTGINAERFGTAQTLYDSAERNIKTLQDLIAIIHALKKDRRYDLVDSYSENRVLVKVEVKAEKQTLSPPNLLKTALLSILRQGRRPLR